MTTSFRNFDLPECFLTALEGRGFTEATPVQAQVLSQSDLNRDMIVQARTGSGKTLGFLLPLLAHIEPSRKPKVLVLSPTRELAMQSADEAAFFGRLRGMNTVAVVGGMSMENQISQLRRGASVVVGTPGRILDHLRRNTLDLSEIDTVVLDEGDSMLDMGFREELDAILLAAHNRRKTWLFSATMPQAMFALCKRNLKNPLHLELNNEEEQHDDIVHRAYLIPSRRREEALINIILWERPELCLIFCHTKRDTGEISGRLQKEGIMALALNGDMTQRERSNALESFRTGRVPVLVATNVAARGIDVQGVTHVIQIGLPDDVETFVHRSGRTGRAGQEGSNILLLSPSESGRFKSMMHNSKIKVEWLKVPDVQEISVIQREVREEALLAAEPSDKIRAWAESMLEKCDDPAELAAKLLASIVKEIPSGYSLRDTLQQELDYRRERGNRGDRGERRRGERRNSGTKAPIFKGRGVSLKVSKGRRDQDWSVGRILGTLCSTLGVNRDEIGNIKMRDSHTEVELSPAAIEALENGGRGRLTDRGLLGGNDGPRIAGPRRERRFSRDGQRIENRGPRRDRNDRGDRKGRGDRNDRRERRSYRKDR